MNEAALGLTDGPAICSFTVKPFCLRQRLSGSGCRRLVVSCINCRDVEARASVVGVSMNFDKSVSFILFFSLHCNHLPVGLVQTPDDVAIPITWRGEIISDL